MSDGSEFVHPFLVIVKLSLRHGFARVFNGICKVIHHEWHRELVLHFSDFPHTPFPFEKNSSHRHHGRFSAHVGDICATIVIRDRDQFREIDAFVDVDRPQVDLEQLAATFVRRERDVNSFFESSSDGIIDILGPVGRGKHHHSLQWFGALALLLLVVGTGAAALPNSVHLDEKLRLDASGGLVFAATAT